ncbi:hypothetical protein DPMN_121944 [Dreissena polymorpha]|uniref:Uncharacterized protein n=1 Tax=Dreissena polymorpha TaxID=45954 RepID=A0A9D4GRL1_DREPO|nr:hypothetical protein DPMN_121944 [Dreissena polymorpha]
MSLDKGSSRLSMRSTITAPQSYYYQVLAAGLTRFWPRLNFRWLHARFTCERPKVRAPFYFYAAPPPPPPPAPRLPPSATAPPPILRTLPPHTHLNVQHVEMSCSIIDHRR